MVIFNAGESIVPILDITSTEDRKQVTDIRYLGTGCFITKKWLITCRHVLQDAKQIPCTTYRSIDSSKRVYDGLKNIKYHPDADIALAEVGKVASEFYKPLKVGASSEIILGQDVTSYSYIVTPEENYKVALTPRLFKGYIMRTSCERQNPGRAYLEVNFPVLKGMSGSPLINDSVELIGVIYQNFRSQVLEDYIEEEYLLQNQQETKRVNKAYKIVEYGIAVDLSKYWDFISSVIA